MKTTRLISTIAFAFALLLSFNAEAQKFSDLDKSPMDAASYPSSYKESDKLIKIVYSRPQLKDREVYDLAKPGKVWRLGANEAAELHVYTDMKLNEFFTYGADGFQQDKTYEPEHDISILDSEDTRKTRLTLKQIKEEWRGIKAAIFCLKLVA